MSVGQAQLRIASADGVGQFDGGPGAGNSRAAAGQDLFLHPCVQIGAATRELDFLTITSLRAVSIAARFFQGTSPGGVVPPSAT